MSASGAMMTTTDLITACASVLESGGYQPVREGFSDWNTTSTRLFEDEYSVVGIAVFGTSAELIQSWSDLQGALVDVISRYVGRAEKKAWDGYLVLLTAAIAPASDADIEGIRADTTRLRKLVATGEDLRGLSDVRRLLRSLLPLHNPRGSVVQGTALDLLPELLAAQGINKAVTQALVKSFVEQEPLMEALRRAREAR